MFNRWMTVATVVATLAVCGPVQAQRAPERPDLTHARRGTTYYNLPGATWEDHQAAVRDCLTTAANGDWGYRMEPGQMYIDEVTARTGFMQGFVENCMVLKGWRVVRLNEWKARDWGRYEAPALARLLAPWVGAEQPEGEIVRVFSNEAANADTVFWRRQAISPPWTFSLRAADLRRLTRYPGSHMNEPGSPGWKPDATPAPIRTAPPYEEPLSAAELAGLPADTAVFLVRVRNVAKRPDTELTMVRMAPREDLWATMRTTASEPGNTASFGGTRGIKARPEAERADMILAFPVNPGRYRVGYRGVVGFCFGAPATEISPGEVVYLGDLDLGEGVLSPDMTLAPAEEWLRQTAPEALPRLRAATWVNGATVACNSMLAYALEFPGYPFEDGYVRGSIPVERWAEQSTQPPT